MTINNFFSRISRQKGSSRVAINTVIIYGQRLSAAAIALITTPIILNALGVDDYGLYVLTVGFVGMLSFVNWSLSAATQRFIAFALGAGDTGRLKRIFASAFFIHFLYGLLLFLLIALSAGAIAERFLNIPAERTEAAKIILYIVSVITFINIITVPFTGLFRAHENFLYLGLVAIFESVLKLGIAVAILFVPFDKLIAYAAFLLGVSVLVFIINTGICKKLYSEVNFQGKNLDKPLIAEMLGFMGWSILGAAAIMGRNQGVSVILNLFFGVVVNAAYGIAMQVKFAVGMLAQGITGSISPQIVKSAGAGETEKMIYLMRTMSKLAVLTTSMVAIPFLIEAPYILKLWLGNVPEWAVVFSRLIIVFVLATGLSAGIQTVFDAIGKVKLFNIYVSLVLLLNLPLAFLFFKLGAPAYTIILTGIFLEVIALFVRLFLLKKYLGFSIPLFLYDIIFRLSLPILATAGLVLVLKQINLPALPQLVFTFMCFFSVYPALVYRFSLDERQKEAAHEIISKTVSSAKKAVGFK
jgi:O-antigen/teichoic acid export membrane protein